MYIGRNKRVHVAHQRGRTVSVIHCVIVAGQSIVVVREERLVGHCGAGFWNEHKTNVSKAWKLGVTVNHIFTSLPPMSSRKSLICCVSTPLVVASRLPLRRRRREESVATTWAQSDDDPKSPVHLYVHGFRSGRTLLGYGTCPSCHLFPNGFLASKPSGVVRSRCTHRVAKSLREEMTRIESMAKGSTAPAKWEERRSGRENSSFCSPNADLDHHVLPYGVVAHRYAGGGWRHEMDTDVGGGNAPRNGLLNRRSVPVTDPRTPRSSGPFLRCQLDWGSQTGEKLHLSPG